MKRLFTLLSLLFLYWVAVCAQTTISGNWWGRIDLGVQKLSIGFQLNVSDNGSKTALMGDVFFVSIAVHKNVRVGDNSAVYDGIHGIFASFSACCWRMV